MSLRNASDLTQRKTDQTKYFDHVRLRGLVAQGALGKVLTINDFIGVVNGGVLQFDNGGNVVGCQTCPVVSSNGGGGGGGGGGNNTRNQFNWATALSTNDTSVLPSSITVDNDGNIYIYGYYGSTTSDINIYSSNQSSIVSGILPINNINNNTFIAKFSSSGQFIYVLGYEGATNIINNAMTVDNLNNIYITGKYSGTSNNIYVYNSNFTSSSNCVLPTPLSSGQAAFIISYDSHGLFRYATAIDGTFITDNGRSIAIDNSNNLYLTGSYKGNSNTIRAYNSNISSFTTRILPTANNSAALFVAKYSPTGQFQYSTSITSTNISDSFIPNSILCDRFNNIYVYGQYFSTSNNARVFGSNINTYTTNVVTDSSTNPGSIFLVKYNNQGEFTYIKSIVSTLNNTTNLGCNFRFLSIDNNNNLYISGNYSTNSDTDIVIYSNTVSDSIGLLPSTNYRNSTFIIKFDNNDKYADSYSILSDNDLYAGGIIVGNSNLYISGTYESVNMNQTYIASSIEMRASNILQTVTNTSSYLISMDSNRSFRYSSSIFGSNTILVNDISYKNNNIYLCGEYYTATSNNIIVNYSSNQYISNILPSTLQASTYLLSFTD
jgi:hypothetical protein